MNTKNYMPIREFSFLTGISKDSLRFYDKIGLLSPEVRGDNQYRYYTDQQIELAVLISDLRVLGVSLEEIKRYADERSPERMLVFFREQNTRIEEEIQRLHRMQELMRLRTDMAVQAMKYKEDTVVLEKKEREPIFLCPVLDSNSTDMHSLSLAYDYAASQGVNVSFPFGAVISPEVMETNTWTCPPQYYFKVRENYNTWKREGTYAVFYRSMEESPEEMYYGPLLNFIEEHGLHMEGMAYEEYLLDELSVKEWEQYRLRIEVRVSRPADH